MENDLVNGITPRDLNISDWSTNGDTDRNRDTESIYIIYIIAGARASLFLPFLFIPNPNPNKGGVGGRNSIKIMIDWVITCLLYFVLNFHYCNK